MAAAAGGLLAAALGARLAALLPWALATLGAEYATWLALRGGPVDGRSPLYAACFFLLAELAYRGVEPGAARPDRRLALRRSLAVAALTAAALGLGALVLAAASLPVGGGVALEAPGVAAAAAVLALVARLARREAGP